MIKGPKKGDRKGDQEPKRTIHSRPQNSKSEQRLGRRADRTRRKKKRNIGGEWPEEVGKGMGRRKALNGGAKGKEKIIVIPGGNKAVGKLGRERSWENNGR